MNMYGKIIGGKFYRSKYGCSEQEALKNGFKPVVLTKPPYSDNMHYPVESLEETENEIVRHWTLVELPPIDDTDEEATESDYIEALQDLGVDVT